jgi:ribosomal-protein-serine acetyltransferase
MSAAAEDAQANEQPRRMTIPTLDLGSGLALSPLTMADAEELFAVIEHNRANLREWLTWVDQHESVAQVEESIREIHEADLERTGRMFALRDRGSIVGMAGFTKISEDLRTGEISYWLGAASRGRGWITQAGEALVAHGFDALGLNRIRLEIVTGNVRSRAVAGRLGCSVDRIEREALHLNGKLVDVAVFGLSKSDWSSQS